jgi:CheY-like chemotaxis protein
VDVTGRRVLVVDDDRVLRQVVVAVVGAEPGARIDEAGTVHSGIDMAFAGRPDVILLDERLPDGSGLAAVPTLRQLCPDAVILLHTGADLSEEEVIAAGCDGLLRKGEGAVAALAQHLDTV